MVFFGIAGQFAQSQENENQSPIVMELFTSHGCSSCPPADTILSELGLQSEWKDRLIPLAFHIDYWDNGGWKDPFSQKEWTYRQMRYSRSFFTNDYIYTPQLVVQGSQQCLGSDKAKVIAQIRHALRLSPTARVKISGKVENNNQISIQIDAELLKKTYAKELWGLVALYQNGLETHVEKGENEGKDLQNNYVVRKIFTAFTFDPQKSTQEQKLGAIDIDSSWQFTEGGLAAWVQDPATMRIYGADSIPVTLPDPPNVSMNP